MNARDHDWDTTNVIKGRLPKRWDKAFVPPSNAEVRMYTERVPVLHLPHRFPNRTNRSPERPKTSRPSALRQYSGTGGNVSRLHRPTTSGSKLRKQEAVAAEKRNRFWRGPSVAEAKQNIAGVFLTTNEDEYAAALRKIKDLKRQQDAAFLVPPPPLIYQTQEVEEADIDFDEEAYERITAKRGEKLEASQSMSPQTTPAPAPFSAEMDTAATTLVPEPVAEE